VALPYYLRFIFQALRDDRCHRADIDLSYGWSITRLRSLRHHCKDYDAKRTDSARRPQKCSRFRGAYATADE